MTPPVAVDGFHQPNILADDMGVDVEVPRLPSTSRLNLRSPMLGVSTIPRNSISLNDPEDPQPNLLADQMGVDVDVPRSNPMPQPNFLADNMGVDVDVPRQLSTPRPNNPEDPFGFHDGPRHNLAPQRLANEYGVNNIVMPPEVQLPANWDAPLQNPMPIVPPMPVPPRPRRGRRRAPSGPRHDISGSQSDPAINRLHHGHIAHREQAANHRAQVQILLQQRQQQQEQLAQQRQIEEQ